MTDQNLILISTSAPLLTTSNYIVCYCRRVVGLPS